MRFQNTAAVLLVVLAACGGGTVDDAGIDAVRPDLGAVDIGTTDLSLDAPCTTDADGDGHRAISCGGDDCDDADANRYPGNHEVCDTTNHDEDCDPSTFGFRDSDGDGYGDDACCNVNASGTMTCGTDCDDANGNVHPMQTESCNGVDDNCNGMIDEGAPGSSFWPDCDGDGFGATSATPMMGCAAPTSPPICAMPMGTISWVTNGTDCNDATSMVHPGAAGTCDCVAGGGDVDHDGHLATACGGDDCADTVAATYVGAPEICDGADNDCDGRPDYPLATPCVPCGTSGCSGEVCCEGDSSCVTTEAACTAGLPMACDGPEDCGSGDVCCKSAPMAVFRLRCAPTCSDSAAYDAIVCHTSGDCPSGETCTSFGSWSECH